MHLSDVAAPILCSHALHGKESVMACRSRLFLFHGTSLLASHAVSSSLLTSCCRRKYSHQVLRIYRPYPVASRFPYTTTQLCFYTTEQLCFRIFTHCHLSICIHIFCIVQFFTYHKFSLNFEIHPRPALCLSSFSLLQVVHLYQYLLHCAVFTNFPRTLRYTRVLLGAKGFACRPCEICG